MIAFLMINKQMTFFQGYSRNTKSVIEVFPNLIIANLPSLNSACILELQEVFSTFRTDLHQDQNLIASNVNFAELMLQKLQKAEGLLNFIYQETGYISKSCISKK